MSSTSTPAARWRRLPGRRSSRVSVASRRRYRGVTSSRAAAWVMLSNSLGSPEATTAAASRPMCSARTAEPLDSDELLGGQRVLPEQYRPKVLRIDLASRPDRADAASEPAARPFDGVGVVPDDSVGRVGAVVGRPRQIGCRAG